MNNRLASEWLWFVAALPVAFVVAFMSGNDLPDVVILACLIWLPTYVAIGFIRMTLWSLRSVSHASPFRQRGQ